MRAGRFDITDALIDSIAVRVQGGAFPHVAAEAAGVPADVFHEWMQRGTGPAAEPPFRTLAERVRHAHGHARCMAEIALRDGDPKAWLLNGPGKDSDSLPGWAMPVKGRADAERGAVNVLLDPQMQALLNSLLDVLAPFPDARAALAAALEARARAK